MKRTNLYYLLFILSFLYPMLLHATEDVDFKLLDKEIEKKSLYEQEYEQKLSQMRERPHANTYDYHMIMFNANCYYNSDSAFYHVNKCYEIAQKNQNPDQLYEALIHKALYYSAVGLFTEADNLLENETLTNRSKSQRLSYYKWAFYHYQHLASYVGKGPLAEEYNNKMLIANDSITMLAGDSPSVYYHTVTGLLAKQGKISEKEKGHLIQWIESHEVNSRDYALNTLTLSMIYGREKNKKEQLHYLIQSAIADLRTANHEVYSIQSLALICFADGDLDRAQRYIKVCIDDARIYGNRVRAIEISNAQDIIHKAYSEKIENQKRHMLLLLGFLAILVFVLAFFILYTLKQKKLVHKKNDELTEQIILVKKTKDELTHANMQLHEANIIKEEYIGHFLKMCSEYVNKMDEFRKFVNRKVKVGQLEDLLKHTSDNQSMENEQKNLFTKFDKAFMHLYPNFAKNLNLLLKPNEQLTIQKGECLSNEMRICALIRLGIKDSGQIASFTGYSVNTIYTYRTKVRNKALDRDEFENQIMQIGLN